MTIIMTSNINLDLPRSLQNLWTLLSGSLNLKSMQFIADELQQSQEYLINGVLFYKRHDPLKDSIDELKRRKISTSLTPQVLHNLSVFLDLEAQQCYRLFESYILFEYRGTPESIKSLFSNEKHIRDLFDNLWNFYYSERLFSLFCLKQILCNWKSSEHIYGKIFEDFLRHVDVGNFLLTKLNNQLKYLISFDFESRSKYGHYFNEIFHQKLKENILQEQVEILQLLLLYYQNFEPSIEKIMEMLQLFNLYGFNPKIQSPNNLSAYIGFLKSLLIVETFDLNFLYKCKEKDIEHFLFKTKNMATIEQLNEMIMNMSIGVVEHSPIFLSWMIVCNLKSDLIQNSNHCTQLGMKALELHVFDYIQRNIELPQVIALKGNAVFNLIYEIIGNLLSILGSAFSLEKLIQNTPSLNSLLIQLFSNDFIAIMIANNPLTFGLGTALSYALDLFPFKTHSLLSFYHSLSQTSLCKHLFEQMSILQNLTSYTEPVNELSLEDYIQLDGDTIELRRDRLVYNNQRLSIPKGTIGVLFNHESIRLVKFEVKNFDGWLLIYCRLNYLITQIRHGQMYETMMNDEVALVEISKVTFICSQLIAHNAYHTILFFNDIIKLLLESFKLMVGFKQSSVRLFLASVTQLAGSIIKTNFMPTSQLWFFLIEKTFFPYMIGFSTKFEEILNGTDTNISTFGYILSSDESINGHYELTFSFLDLIAQCAKKGECLNEKTTIASFIFIIRDIFPSHKLWNYLNEQDANRIGRICMQIFYDILNRARKKSKEEMLQIERICTVLLMEGNAAEYLLQIVKNGEMMVKRKILNAGNDSALVSDDQIVTVRTSLLVLSYLLELYTQICEWSGHKKKSVIEEMLFNSMPSCSPNMLLTFAHFVYQTYDIHLATNAVHLLSQLALKFPMSMLACFGSNTESIRDHFLFRLETVTEDINFKISLLRFLLTCIDHQPGLVEMFLNASNDQRGVLNTILEILKEKLDGQYFCPFELHRASLEFVAKFWLKLNIIAINLLKSNDQFWKLVTFPLFPNKEETFDHSLCTFILKILSREIFYTKMLEKESFSKELMAVFNRMKTENTYAKISTHIHNNIVANLNIGKNEISLIDAWKDFLLSSTKFQVLPKDISLELLMDDVMKNLLILLSNNENREYLKVINKFSNLLLIISSDVEIPFDQLTETVPTFYTNLVGIFQKINQNMEVISFNSIISLETFLLKFSHTNRQLHRTDLFTYNCVLLSNSLKIISKSLSTVNNNNILATSKANNQMHEKRLVMLCLFNIITILDGNHSNALKYLNILRQHQINELTQNLLLYIIHHNIHLDLAQNLLLYFVSLSHHSEGSDMLYNLNLINSVIIHYQIPSNIFTAKVDDVQQCYVQGILSSLLRIVINITIHLRHHFLESSISFIAIYNDTFKELCKQFRLFPKKSLSQLTLLVFKLCATLSKYIKIWNDSHPISLNSLTEEILLTSNSMIAFLLRPNILAKSIDTAKASNVFSKFNTTVGNRNELNPLVEDLQDQLCQVLLQSFHFIMDISPNLFDLFENDTLNVSQHSLLLTTNFSIPNSDAVTLLTFGAIVNLINNTIKLINKENANIGSKRDEKVSNRLEMNVNLLEYALAILLVQTLIAKCSTKINEMDKQLFFREINSEVSTFKSNLLSKTQKRLSERQNSFSANSQMSISPIKSQVGSINLMERPFIKLVFNLVENVIQ